MRTVLALGLMALASLAFGDVTRKSGSPDVAVQLGVNTLCTTITNPTKGLMCYDDTTDTIKCYSGTAWAECNPGSGTSSGTSGTLNVSNGGGGFTSITRQKIYCGYADLDGNLDGHVDDRTMSDYDCDGTQEGSDWQTGIDNQCDSNTDNLQDGASVDLDSDGTAGTNEKRCGTFRVAPGVYVMPNATDRITLKWKGLTVLGAGTNNTVLKSTFTRTAYCNTHPSTRTGVVQSLDLDGVQAGQTLGSSKGVDYLELGHFTIDNIGARSATAAAGSVTGGPEDCTVDGTADDGVDGGGTWGEGLNNLNLQGLPGDTDSNGTYDTWDHVEHVYVHDIRMINCDGACMFADDASYITAERLEAIHASEHCYAQQGSHHVWSDITGVDCGNKNWGGRGFEVFAGSSDDIDITLTNFSFTDSNIGIGVITADRSAVSPVATPKRRMNGVRVSHGYITTNDKKDTGSLDSGYCLQSNTPSTLAGFITDLEFDDITFGKCSSAGINWSQYDQDTKFSRLRIANTNYDRNGGYAVALAGTRISLVDSDILLADFDGNSTFENAAAVQTNPCTRCRAESNYIHGTLYHTGTVGGFFVENNSPEFEAVDNVLDINLGSALTNAAVGIFIKGSDDGNYVNNTVRLPAVTSKWGFYLNGTAERNRITSNRVLGGRIGYFEETGGQTLKTIGMLNYAAPSVTGDSSVRGFALGNSTADSVWSFNSCMLPDANGFCFDASGSNAVEMFGNAAIAPLTGGGGQRLYNGSNGNVVEIAQPFNGTNNADTGIWVGGAALQGRALCMSGANAVDTFDACFTPTNPTADRRFTTPDASGTMALNQQFFAFISAKGVGNTGATTYLSFAGTATSTTETSVDDYLSPAASTSARNLSCVTATAPDNGAGTQTWTITLRDDAANTALTCTISEAASTCTDTTNVITVGAGSKLDLSVAPASTPAATTEILCSIGVGLT